MKTDKLKAKSRIIRRLHRIWKNNYFGREEWKFTSTDLKNKKILKFPLQKESFQTLFFLVRYLLILHCL